MRGKEEIEQFDELSTGITPAHAGKSQTLPLPLTLF